MQKLLQNQDLSELEVTSTQEGIIEHVRMRDEILHELENL
jgi:hypothetical protein